MYFAPYRAPNEMAFQDGGLRNNNPVKIALIEKNLIWPKGSHVDTFITVGTGDDGPPQTESRIFRAVPIPGFIRRIYTAFNDSLNGEIIWREYFSQLDWNSRKVYHRLNIDLDRDVKLDAISEIEPLEQLANKAFEHNSLLRLTIKRAADSILASLFFFDLESIRKLPDGTYQVLGFIGCRLHRAGGHQQALRRQMKLRNAYFLVDGDVVLMDPPQSADENQDFTLPIEISVLNILETKEYIQVALDTRADVPYDQLVKYPISGFPISFKDVRFPIFESSTISADMIS